MSKLVGSAYCYRVKGMYVPYKTPKNIETHIDDYIARIDGYAVQLEDRFLHNDRNGFITVLETILALLTPVYAKHCISYVTALLDAAKDTKKELKYVERLLQQAIADFLLLSIEMQKAQKLRTAPAVKYKEVEKNEEIARALAAIGRMLSVGNYKEAEEMSHDLRDLNNVFANIKQMIQSRQYDRAKELAISMEKEHIRLIQSSSRSAAKLTKTVLAVDDRQEVLSNVNAALRGHYKVLGALGGKLALDIMAKQKIDLFYLDIDMPDMDGFELTQKIRANPNYKKTPIIFLTANASSENIARGISLGVDDYVVKPSNHVNLLVKARKHMDEM